MKRQLGILPDFVRNAEDDVLDVVDGLAGRCGGSRFRFRGCGFRCLCGVDVGLRQHRAAGGKRNRAGGKQRPHEQFPTGDGMNERIGHATSPQLTLNWD